MNEVTYHYLDTIYTHLFNTKGPLPGKASVGGGAAVAQPMNVSASTDPGATADTSTAATASAACFRYFLLELCAAVVARVVVFRRVRTHARGGTGLFEVWWWWWWCEPLFLTFLCGCVAALDGRASGRLGSTEAAASGASPALATTCSTTTTRVGETRRASVQSNNRWVCPLLLRDRAPSRVKNRCSSAHRIQCVLRRSVFTLRVLTFCATKVLLRLKHYPARLMLPLNGSHCRPLSCPRSENGNFVFFTATYRF